MFSDWLKFQNSSSLNHLKAKPDLNCFWMAIYKKIVSVENPRWLPPLDLILI
jgi:hypothetical protein